MCSRVDDGKSRLQNAVTEQAAGWPAMSSGETMMVVPIAPEKPTFGLCQLRNLDLSLCLPHLHLRTFSWGDVGLKVIHTLKRKRNTLWIAAGWGNLTLGRLCQAIALELGVAHHDFTRSGIWFLRRKAWKC